MRAKSGGGREGGFRLKSYPAAMWSLSWWSRYETGTEIPGVCVPCFPLRIRSIGGGNDYGRGEGPGRGGGPQGECDPAEVPRLTLFDRRTPGRMASTGLPIWSPVSM